MLKQRTFNYIQKSKATLAKGDSNSVKYTYEFNYTTYTVSSRDLFDDEVVIIAYPIEDMQHVDTILRHFGLNDNSYYFFQQLKDLVALPEKHQNEKGDGKLDLQTFFKNVPYSIMSINNKAIVVIALHPLKRKTDDGLNDYNLVGYINANQFEYRPTDGNVYNCYYYSVLRIMDKMVEGESIYRRKKMFMMLFSVLNEICFINDVTFAYASMGKENVSINDALHKCATDAGIHYERLQYKLFGQVNRLWGNKYDSKQLVNISNDEKLLSEYYDTIRRDKESMLFFQPETKEEFDNWIFKITEYSKASGVYAIIENGKIMAATLAVYWGDYFHMLILNPKGVFSLLDKFKVIEKILFPVLTIGDKRSVRKLFKGLAYKFREEEQCQVTFLPSFIGDPYYDVKKGLIDDNIYYFVITRDKDLLQKYKEESKNEKGEIRPFVELPMT